MTFSLNRLVRSSNLGALCLVVCSLLALQVGALAQGKAAKGAPKGLLAQPLTVRWRYPSNGTLNLTPASDIDRIYLPLAGGSIVSLERTMDNFFGSQKSEVNFPLHPSQTTKLYM